MRMQQSHRRGESIIGNSIDAHLTVVVRDIFDQPVDRVISVGCLVHGIRVLKVHVRRQQKLSFRLEPPAKILAYEDVAVLHQLLQRLRNCLRRLLWDAIWGAPQQNRQRTSLVGGSSNYRLEMDAVAHGNHHFLELERRLSVWRLGGLGESAGNEQNNETKTYTHVAGIINAAVGQGRMPVNLPSPLSSHLSAHPQTNMKCSWGDSRTRPTMVRAVGP